MTVATSASDEQEIEIQICEDDEDEIINLDVRGRAQSIRSEMPP